MMAFTLPPTPVICTSKLEGTASYHEGFHAFAYPCYLNKQASAILPITMKAFTILPAPNWLDMDPLLERHMWHVTLVLRGECLL